jgi:iron complex outermembrane receptor protein
MKLDSKILLRLAALTLLARGLSAHAQTATNNPTIRLPETVVTAEREKAPSLTVPSVEQAREAVRAVPGGASVIQAEEFKTGRASTLKDVLEYAPGVFVQPRFGSDEAKISIRGSGSNRITPARGLKILQDGAPLNLADGTSDMQSIEPLSVSYVEVLRGANALKYGGTTLGGAINYVTPTGYTADKLQLRGEYGSYGYARAQASSGMVLGSADYYLSLTDGTQEGYRAHSRQSDQRVFSNFGWRFNDTVETRFYYTYTLADMLLPGAITKAQLEANPRQADPATVAGNRQRNFELHRVANKTSLPAGAGRLEINTFWSHKDYYHPFTTVLDENSNDLGLDAQWRYEGDLFGHRNEFVAGLSPTGGWVDNATFVNNAGDRGALTSQSYRTAENMDFYAQDRHWVGDKLSLVAGVQVSWANRDVKGILAQPSFNQEFWSVNPKAGFIYEQTDTVQYYGNVSRSFEPPSFGDMGNVTIGGVPIYTPREAQSAWTVELGTRGEHGRLTWDVTAYHAWVDNELLSLTLPGGVANGSVNASTTVHMGVEAGLSARLWEGLTTGDKTGAEADAIVARATYLWSRFRFQDDGVFGDNAIAGIPEHYLRFETTYQHPCGFYIGPNIEWVATKSAIDHANTFFVDPYALVGIKAGYRTKKGVSGFVEVRNLTDKRYAATTGALRTAATGPGGAVVDQAQFFPGDGRSVYAGLEWKF